MEKKLTKHSVLETYSLISSSNSPLLKKSILLSDNISRIYMEIIKIITCIKSIIDKYDIKMFPPTQE